MKQGDRNTKFFHKVANANRRFNTIDKLNINGTQVEGLNTIKAEILSFYQQLYKEPEEWRPEFNYPHGSKINELRCSGFKESLMSRKYWRALEHVQQIRLLALMGTLWDSFSIVGM